VLIIYDFIAVVLLSCTFSEIFSIEKTTIRYSTTGVERYTNQKTYREYANLRDDGTEGLSRYGIRTYRAKQGKLAWDNGCKYR